MPDLAASSATDTGADTRAEDPFAWLRRRLGPPRSYRITRWMILRLLGVVYLAAFFGVVRQGLPLLGSHGLTPIATYLDNLRAEGLGFVDVPTLFWANSSDVAIMAVAWIGVALAILVVLGVSNLPILLALWVLYGSIERVGQTWFSFGWEIQILETTLIAAFLAPPLDIRPLSARPPPTTAIVLMRWLTFRIMLGAGLIKLRGDHCWSTLTCLDSHFETQPIPNPLSPWFHHLPHWAHAIGVVFNHFVELIAPWFVFGPRRARIVAGVAMVGFQGFLIVSGNLAFLNWLTLVPVLACFDDDFWLWIVPGRLATWLRARFTIADSAGRFEPSRGHRYAAYAFAVLVAFKSVAVVANLASSHQAMNRSYDRLELVNTYGAFGTVGTVRHELVIEGSQEGTADEPPTNANAWHEYQLPCKPGDVNRRPCILGPYHLRLDWLIWFAAMDDEPGETPWMIHLVWKLLDGDATVRQLLAYDPVDGRAPRWIRIQRFVYQFAPSSSSAWWVRSDEQPWLPPVSLTSPELRQYLAQYGWLSTSER